MDEEKNDEMTKKAENKEKSLFRQVFGTFGPILIIGVIAAIILTAAFMYFSDIDTANYKDKDESNVPYNFFKYSNEINISKDGKIMTKYNAQEIWDNIIKNGGNVDEYLDNASELKKLMDAQLVTQFPDTRSNPDEKIDWSKFFSYSWDSTNTNQYSTINSDSTINVLFIGNSKTFVNDVPALFSNLSNSLGKKVYAGSCTKGGKPLSAFMDEESLHSSFVNKVKERKWDYVVLQEQTETSLSSASVKSGTSRIIDYIKNNCNKDIKVIYKAWGIYNDFNKEQYNQAVQSFEAARSQNAGNIAYIANALLKCHDVHPTINLYTDRVHATMEGSYLATCCVYSAIFGEATEGASYTSTCSADTARLLQQISDDIMNVTKTTDNALDSEKQQGSLTSEVQGIVKFKRANADGTKKTMTYVDPDTYQFNIDEYNRTGSEEAKKEALSHFTIGVNKATTTDNAGQSLAGFTIEQFFAAVKDVADTVYAHRSEYVYGHSTTTPPCEKEASDGMKHISCDRLVAKALYNLGVTDQKAGGITCGDTDFLEAHGFRKIENQSEVQHGDIIVQGDGNKIVHWFVVDTCDSNGNCTKYDMGSNTRIQSKQPMTGQLDAGGNHKFMAAYRVNYASPESIVTTDSEGLGEKRDITSSTVDKDNKNLVNRMQKSLRLSSYSNLSYLIIPYYNFEGKVEKGEMVVCRELADEVLLIFQELYKIKYPIERMELVDNYDAIDWKSIKANNTSAFNYRKANDGKKEYDNLSNHAYGKCIDINPLINPYIVNYHVSLESAYTTHELGGNPDYKDKYKYRDSMTGWTDIEKKARIAKGTDIYNIFTKYGWQWLEYAGDTNKDLDSQHFQKLDTTNVKVINRTTTQTNSSGNASTSSSANKSTSNIIFIGDSRTEGIRDTVKSDSKFICLGSQGYSWMKNTAFPQADQIVNANSKVIIWMGVNDLGNIDNYIKEVNNKASQWTSKGAKVYYAAVGPLGWDDQYASNSGIESFNKKLKEGLAYNVSYIELYQYLKNNGYKTVDSTHYNSETNKKVYDYLVNAVSSGVTSSSNMPTESPFTKYELTDQELTALTAVSFSEPGWEDSRGAASEASIIANLFELREKGSYKGKTGGTGLYNFVKYSGWFAEVSKYIDSGCKYDYDGNYSPVTEEEKAVVRSVLVDGKRTLPGYIDEHDSWSGKDFNAYNDGKEITYSRESYIQFKTHIDNDYSSHYTFWGWGNPDNEESDPFGYTSEENRARIGEFYYDYESGNAIGDANIANQETTYYVKVATWNQTITEVEYTEPGKDGYTDVTYNMTSQNINYQDFLSGYILPFNYLWAHLVITEDKDFVMELADLVYNSEIEITVHDNFSETTSQNSEDYWSTIYVAKGRDSSGEIIYGPERAMFQKLTTITYRNNTIETALTRANVWIVDYKQDFEYQTTSNGSKWVAKEKDIREKTEIDTDEKNFVTILRNHGTARNAIFECDSWLFEIIEEPDNGISDMLDLTKYLIYKATGVKYDGIDTYDFGVYDPDTFKKTSTGTGGASYSSINITPEELEILYKITSAERGGGTQQQQEYVVCVILNRVLSSDFPNSVKEVVYQPHQFEPVSNGSFNTVNPSATTKAAVDNVIKTGDKSQYAVYFMTPKASIAERNQSWVSKLKYLFNDTDESLRNTNKGGSHNFYTKESVIKELQQYSTNNNDIIATADKYVGNPYVWGGNSLTNGCDCSHFVRLILIECGKIPESAEYHTTADMRDNGLKDWGAENIGTDPSKAQAGDIVLYSGHVAFYDGNGLIVEAKGSEWGITHDRDVNCKSIKAIFRVK